MVALVELVDVVELLCEGVFLSMVTPMVEAHCSRSFLSEKLLREGWGVFSLYKRKEAQNKEISFNIKTNPPLIAIFF